jgi:hypothetical protein
MRGLNLLVTGLLASLPVVLADVPRTELEPYVGANEFVPECPLVGAGLDNPWAGCFVLDGSEAHAEVAVEDAVAAHVGFAYGFWLADGTLLGVSMACDAVGVDVPADAAMLDVVIAEPAAANLACALAGAAATGGFIAVAFT